MAERHDARLAELVTELGGDEVRFLFRDLVQQAMQELIDAELLMLEHRHHQPPLDHGVATTS